MPPLEIVFTTKGIGNLVAVMNAVGKKFDDLDAKINNLSAGTKFTQGAKDLVIAAVYLERSADKIVVAAQMLKSASNIKVNINNRNSNPNNQNPKNPKKKPPGFMQKLQSLIGTSRVSFGKGGLQVMPLVNKLTAFLPPEARAIAEIAIAAGTAIFELGKAASEAGIKMMQFQFALGSDSITSGKLRNIGAASGLDASAVASIAQSMNSRIIDDPMARSIGLQMGVYNPTHGPYGNQDYGKQLKTVVDGLRKIQNIEERLTVARTLGVEALLPSTMTSNAQYAKQDGDATVSSKIFDSDFATKSADFADALGRLTNAGENVIAALGKASLPKLTEWFNWVADLLNGLADWMSKNQNVVKALVDLVSAQLKFLQADVIGAGKEMKNAWDDLNSPNQQANSALNDNADATRDNTNQLRANTNAINGTFGRGARMNGVIPDGLNGRARGQALSIGGGTLQLNPF